MNNRVYSERFSMSGKNGHAPIWTVCDPHSPLSYILVRMRASAGSAVQWVDSAQAASRTGWVQHPRMIRGSNDYDLAVIGWKRLMV